MSAPNAGFWASCPAISYRWDEITDGLAVLQDLVLQFPGLDVGGPWTDVDVTADCTVGEDERVRVQDGYEVDITYPNTVPAYTGAKEYFDADSWTATTARRVTARAR